MNRRRMACIVSGVAFSVATATQAQEPSVEALRARILVAESSGSRVEAVAQLSSRSEPRDCEGNCALLEELLQRCKEYRPSTGVGSAELQSQALSDARTLVFVFEGLLLNHEYYSTCRAAHDRLVIELASTDNKWLSRYAPGFFTDLFLSMPDDASRRRQAWAVLACNPACAGNGWAAARVFMNVDAYDADAATRARQLWSESLEAGRPNSGVMELLADRGEQSILSAVKDIVDAGNESSALTFYARDAVWRIEVQRSPETLLGFLESGQPDERTEWVIRRAIEMKVPRQRLGKAVREYYQKCPAEGLLKARMAGLDQVVVGNEIVSFQELPSAFVPPRPTH